MLIEEGEQLEESSLPCPTFSKILASVDPFSCLMPGCALSLGEEVEEKLSDGSCGVAVCKVCPAEDVLLEVCSAG